MNRYTIHDRKVHEDQKFGYRTGERWAILDRTTNKLVDEATTKYEAQQAVKGWNAGVYDAPEKCPESGRTAAWCTDQSHETCGVGIAAGIVVDRYQDA